ncbi:MAG TPA: DegT/DnrJ/EryC1/StrS family aminotransferase [Thermoanaerobaculia bacterium]|nr:DegT/DnrJ/EryC1/StrS family aminotransferase [Thermoanaerobaculia bacterium]
MTSTALGEEVSRLPPDQDASGRTLGHEELERLREVLASGVLTSTRGSAVRAFESRFAELLGARHAHACSSGTAAIHAAVAAIDPEPGDEIVTTPITDMGALAPILYQGAIPVFADVDPRTCNVTAATLAERLSRRTRAIVVTHLFGNPCPMDEIMELARHHRLPVIEDCAQAYGATYGGRPVGSIGTIGCFSLGQGQHITTGEGGIAVSSSEFLSRRIFLFINKAWVHGEPWPDHSFLALNYRMSELQGAVALAQLDRLASAVGRRIAMAKRLREQIAGLPGIEAPWVPAGGEHSYWKFCLWVDRRVLAGGSEAVGRILAQHGVASLPRYIRKPAFQCQLFRHQRTFGSSRFPFTLARPEAVDYSHALFPGTFQGLEEILVLPWNERYTEEHVDLIAEAVGEAVEHLLCAPRSEELQVERAAAAPAGADGYGGTGGNGGTGAAGGTGSNRREVAPVAPGPDFGGRRGDFGDRGDRGNISGVPEVSSDNDLTRVPELDGVPETSEGRALSGGRARGLDLPR